MATPQEDVMPMPLDVVQASAGVAVDIGGSMAKIIYRSKKDYCSGVPLDQTENETRMGKVRSVQFPRDDVDTYVAYLRENCDVIEGRTMYATGIGGSQYKAKLETLGVKLQMLTEFECFVKSLNIMLERFPKQEWLLPLNEKGLEAGLKHLKLMNLFKDMTAGRPFMTADEFDRVYRSQVDAYVERCHQDRDHLAGTPYPYLMVMCGSAFGFVKVEKDGSCDLVEVSLMSGRFFLGMSAILTQGEKDYLKYIDLAETHDGSTVDSWGSDLKTEGQADDMYSRIEEDVRAFPFGKAHDVPLVELKTGDMISSLLQCLCENIALATFNVAKLHGCKHAYFCGGFVSQEIARRSITMGMCWRCLLVPPGERVHIEFIAKSGHLGSVGAFLGPTNVSK